MARKGMSLTLKVIVTVVIILVVAFVLLTYFSSGSESVWEQINSWIGEVEGRENPVEEILDKLGDGGGGGEGESTTPQYRLPGRPH